MSHLNEVLSPGDDSAAKYALSRHRRYQKRPEDWALGSVDPRQTYIESTRQQRQDPSFRAISTRIEEVTRYRRIRYTSIEDKALSSTRC
jgi:hypothetical protein